MSGETSWDALGLIFGGEGDDLIWGGAGSDIIKGGAGNDIIVSNMAATHLTDAMEGTVPAGFTRGPDNVVSYEGGEANAQGKWWVERSEDGSTLRVPRAYVKNPDGGYTYWPEAASDQDFVDAGDGDDHVWGGRGADKPSAIRTRAAPACWTSARAYFDPCITRSRHANSRRRTTNHQHCGGKVIRAPQ